MRKRRIRRRPCASSSGPMARTFGECLGQDLQLVKDAVSAYCRLGFAFKRGTEALPLVSSNAASCGPLCDATVRAELGGPGAVALGTHLESRDISFRPFFVFFWGGVVWVFVFAWL